MQACVGLVECAERGELSAAKTKELVQQNTTPLLEEGAGTVGQGGTNDR
mgnify:CR=1 FL=1